MVLNYLVSPKYNAERWSILEIGAKKAGRKLDDIDRPQLVVCSVDHDRKKALDGARKLVTQYLGQQPHIMKASGVCEDLLDEIGQVLALAGDRRSRWSAPWRSCRTTSCS